MKIRIQADITITLNGDRLCPPQQVRLEIDPMANAILTWTASPSDSVTQYTVSWLVNGVGQNAPVVTLRDPDGDTNGYSADFNTAIPGVVLNPGDVVEASITADDTNDGLTSSPVVVDAVVPSGPVAPEPPQNVTLTIV